MTETEIIYWCKECGEKGSLFQDTLLCFSCFGRNPMLTGVKVVGSRLKHPGAVSRVRVGYQQGNMVRDVIIEMDPEDASVLLHSYNSQWRNAAIVI